MKPDRNTILVAGGDLRYVYTAHALSARCTVHAAGFSRRIVPFDDIILTGSAGEPLPVCDVLVLPMPVSEDGVFVPAPFSSQSLSLKKLAACVRPDGLVLGGRFGKAAALFRDMGLTAIDYLEREELSTLNAIPTAEGALQLLLEEMPVTIHNSRILVLGFGRIGSHLAAVLHGLGAHVSVASREVAELARAELRGCHPVLLSRLHRHTSDFDVIINTIPAPVADESYLAALTGDPLLLDLASKPGGIDWEAARKYGRRAVWALSLPGKTAPITAGRIIARTICNILDERSGSDD